MRPSLPRPLAIALLAMLLTLPLRADPPGASRAPDEATRQEARQILARVAREATEIVVGEVVRATARPVDAGRRIVTRVIFRVDRRLRGGHEAILELLLPGGRLGELGQKVGGVPLVAPGDRLLLFLRPEGPGQAHTRLSLTLLGSSLWRVVGDTAQLAPEGVRLVTRPGAAIPGPLRLPLEFIEAQIRKTSLPDRETP